jgi:uncharacterized protein YndB with AHSA1/START domain
MEEQKIDVTHTAQREITATRVIPASRAKVFRVWTDAGHIVHWWGPNGFTSTIESMDVRPGGVWQFVMHGPDGKDYKNQSVYVEVTRPDRLVYDHVSGPKFRATVTFEEMGGETKLSMQMLFETAAERDKTIEVFGAVEGLNQTLTKLARYVARLE